MLGFLQSGGLFTTGQVEYRDVRLPRSLFAGTALGGVGYLQQIIDYGAKIEPGPDDRFAVELPDGLRFESHGPGLVNLLLMIVERFIADEYSWLDATDRVVIDIGANIGDSTLYFVRRGAAYVYAYEPDAEAHHAAVRNLSLNGVANADVERAAAGSGSSVSLRDMVSRATAEHPGRQIIFKIDCEGCEYELLEADQVSEALRPVEQVMVEYHQRSPEPLVKALEDSGFAVESSAGAPGVGWIRARRLGAA